MACPGCTNEGAHTYTVGECELSLARGYYGDRWKNQPATQDHEETE